MRQLVPRGCINGVIRVPFSVSSRSNFSLSLSNLYLIYLIEKLVIYLFFFIIKCRPTKFRFIGRREKKKRELNRRGLASLVLLLDSSRLFRNERTNVQLDAFVRTAPTRRAAAPGTRPQYDGLAPPSPRLASPRLFSPCHAAPQQQVRSSDSADRRPPAARLVGHDRRRPSSSSSSLSRWTSLAGGALTIVDVAWSPRWWWWFAADPRESSRRHRRRRCSDFPVEIERYDERRCRRRRVAE